MIFMGVNAGERCTPAYEYAQQAYLLLKSAAGAFSIFRKSMANLNAVNLYSI